MKKLLYLFVINLLTIGLLWGVNDTDAIAKVEFEYEDIEYKVGDIINVDVVISPNLSENILVFNNVFFDIEYDGYAVKLDKSLSKLSESSVRSGCDVKYAVNDNTKIKENRGIFSLIWDDNQIITNKAILMNLAFKVIRPVNGSSLRFNECKVQRYVKESFSNEDLYVPSLFVNSPVLRLYEEPFSSFIYIRKPYNGKILSDDNTKISLLFTNKLGNYVKILNEDTSIITDKLENTKGNIDDIEVKLIQGKNTISAYLYDKNDVQLATDSISIHQSSNTNILKISNPYHNSIVNKRKIVVSVESKLKNVFINNIPAEIENNRINTETYEYRKQIDLKPGFNTIYVKAEGIDDKIHKEELTVYFEKSDDIFRILKPQAGKLYKYNKNDKSNIVVELVGELDQVYDNRDYPISVYYKLIYTPIDGSPIISAPLKADIIAPTTDDIGVFTESAYLFKDNIELDLKNHNSGHYEIEAYRVTTDRTQVQEKYKSSKRVYFNIDNSKLEIILDQPNIYNDDYLSSKSKISKFNSLAKNNEEVEFGNINVSENGNFTLTKSLNLTDIINNSNTEAAGLIEVDEGNLLQYTNSKVNNSYFHVISPTSSIKNIYSDIEEDFYIYDILKTEKGLLLGVGNNSVTTNSGLYLLDNEKNLHNIRIGKPLDFVQFIRRIDNHIYLYSSDSSHIFSFNLYSLISQKDKNESFYTTNEVESIPFNNSLTLKDFQMSPQLNTIALLTQNGDLKFFSKINNEYKEVEDLIDKNSNNKVKNIVFGKYNEGIYYSWLIQGNELISTVMENKKTGYLSYFGNDELKVNNYLGAYFKNDRFHILTKDINNRDFLLNKGKILFNKFKYNPRELLKFKSSNDIVDQDSKLIITDNFGIFWGNGKDSEPLYNLKSIIKSSGTLRFSYKNQDITGIKGISFNIPSKWINKPNIGFDFKYSNGNETYLSKNFEEEDFTKIYEWKENLSDNKKWNNFLTYSNEEYKLNIEFVDTLDKNGILDFKLNFLADRFSSPEINTLKVKTKNLVLIPEKDDGNTNFVIRGWVTDPTVKTVSIDNYSVNVDNGYFTKEITIPSTLEEPKEINVSATNIINDNAKESFTISTVKSINKLVCDSYYYMSNDGTMIPIGENQKEVTKSKIYISGKYMGLKGATVEYELKDGKKKGLATTRDDVFNSTDFNIPVNEQINLETGIIGKRNNDDILTHNSIDLKPGLNSLTISVVNPGGQKNSVTKEFNYKMDPLDEKIEVFNINKNFLIKEVINNDGTYSFQRTFILMGEVKTLESIKELKISASDDGIKFLNGSEYSNGPVYIKVDEHNTFKIPIKIELNSEQIFNNFELFIKPKLPQHGRLKTSLILKTEKDYRGANIFPDFSEIDPEENGRWKDDEREANRKKILIRFNEPVPQNSKMKLTVNYENTIIGELVKSNNFNEDELLYELMSAGEPQEISNLHQGTNRVRWDLYYKKDGNDALISSSTDHSNSNMKDFIFSFMASDESFSEKVTFNPILNKYYDNVDSIPEIKLLLKKSTNAVIKLNDNIISEVTGEGKDKEITVKLTDSLIEGLNRVKVTTYSGETLKINYEYSFLYDSKEPGVGEPVIRVNDNNEIVFISAIIKEANIEKICIQNINPDGKISTVNVKPKIRALNNSYYKAIWDNFDSLGENQLNLHKDQEEIRILVSDFVGRKKESQWYRGPISSHKSLEFDSELLWGSEEDNNNFNTASNFISNYYFKKDISPNYWWSIYNEDITIESGALPAIDSDVAKVFSTGNMNFKMISDQEKPIHAYIGSNGSASFENDFSIPLGQELKLFIRNDFESSPKSRINKVYNNDPIPDDENTQYKEFGMHFSLIVHDSYFFSNNNNKISPILTLYSNGIDMVYIGYVKSRDNYKIVLSTDPFFDPQYRTITLAEKRNYGEVYSNRFNFSGDNVTFYHEDKKESGSASSKLALPTDFLNYNSKLHIGSVKAQLGRFSISNVFYSNTKLTSTNIKDQLDSINDMQSSFEIPDQGHNYTIKFNNVANDNNHTLIDLSNARVTDFEDVEYIPDYIPAINEYGRALIASSKHRNAINSDRLIFKDCTAPIISNNLLVNSSNDTITLTPTNVNRGRYVFGNKPTNHGLKKSEYYSISGSVNSINDKYTNSNNDLVDAEIVLLFNGKEMRYQLYGGVFHFVYDNTTMETPENIILYIDTKEKITLSKNFVLTEGLSKLNPELFSNTNSYAKTSFIYQRRGNVELYYKPFNIDNYGFASSRAYIYDSDTIKIKTEARENLNRYCYTVIVGNKTIKSNVPVTGGWHNLIVTYSVDDQQIRFFVDGNIAAFFDYSKTDGNEKLKINGGFETSENVFIGSNKTLTAFAEGYIDNFTIAYGYNPKGHTYFPDSKVNLKLVEYNADNNEIYLDLFDAFYADYYLYPVKTSDEQLPSRPIDSYTNLSIIRKKLDITPGCYFVKSVATFNEKRAESYLWFLRDDKPKFTVTKKPNLVVKGIESNLKFNVEFDSSYLTQMNDERLAGFAIKIMSEGIDETIYLKQNHLSTKEDSQEIRWLYAIKNDTAMEWKPISNSFNSIVEFELVFNDIKCSEDLNYYTKSYYFNSQDYEKDVILNIEDHAGEIPTAALNELEQNDGTYKYMQKISLLGATAGDTFPGYEKYKIRYTTSSTEKGKDKKTEGYANFDSDGYIKLYYDDLFGSDYGKYKIEVELLYNNNGASESEYISEHSTKSTIEWKRFKLEQPEIVGKSTLNIKSFDFVSSSKDENNGVFYLSYDFSPASDIELNSQLELKYKITSTEESDSGVSKELGTTTGELIGTDFRVIEGVKLSSSGKTYITLELTGYKDSEKFISASDMLNVTIEKDVPEIVFTNTVPFYIPYNSMTFTWKGLLKGKPNNNIKYSYKFDDVVEWNTANQDWDRLELHNIKEGKHSLKVKAFHNNTESKEYRVNFLVDTKDPSFNESQIKTKIIYDDFGTAQEVNFCGGEGAVTDLTLTRFTINDTLVEVDKLGKFDVTLKLEKEGINKFTFFASDRLGHTNTLVKEVENSLFEILSPRVDRIIKYAPFTLVGKLNEDINQNIKVYAQDSVHKSIWHEGRINSDRVFYIDDISINPGLSSRNAITDIKIKLVFDSGVEITKDIQVKAQKLYRPLEVSLSRQTAQGAGNPVDIDITAECNIEDIASWSIDYDGDGIYDDIVVNDSGYKDTKKVWKHSYSTLGKVTPRVRIITKSGDYFSESTSLIIHEEVKKATTISVNNSIDMSTLHLDDESEKVYILRKDNTKVLVDIYTINNISTHFSMSPVTIDITEKVDGEPTGILVLSKKSFIVSSVPSRELEGNIIHFKLNDYGNFDVANRCTVNSPIASMAKSHDYVFVTLKNNSELLRYLRGTNEFLDKRYKSFTLREPIENRDLAIGSELTYLNGSIYATDILSQRIIEYSPVTLEPVNYWGEYGENDNQFIRPSLISAFANRLFVYDSIKENIQVYEDEKEKKTSITSIDQSFLKNNELNSLTSISSFGRDSGGGRYYHYIIALSSDSNKLSIIKLPLWKELRVQTRNNKIVFLNKGEMYTAKPDGSDIKKVLSTDSLPRIEGRIDYPTISPDGRRIAFITSKNIYTGDNKQDSTAPNSNDKLYIYQIGEDRPIKVSIRSIKGRIERPIFNSNGSKIAFSAKSGTDFWKLYEYDWSNGTATELFPNQENLRFPFYSPSDRYIVCTTDYDGDEEIVIFDKENPLDRIEVTSNNSRDSYPVWSRLYFNEIQNTESEIDSKIAFVSNRYDKTGVHYTYIAKGLESGDIRVVNEFGESIEDDPDSAAKEITTTDSEGDYPTFTGDGKNVVFQGVNQSKNRLVKWNHKDGKQEDMNLPLRSEKPSGMRNTITGFNAELINGNDLQLTWNPYTVHKVLYKLKYKIIDSAKEVNFVTKKVYSQDNTFIKGLELDAKYSVNISIEENGRTVAETKWITIETPSVIAKPTITINKDNPYRVDLKAWRPNDDPYWLYTWVFDGVVDDIPRDYENYSHIFKTAGIKNIVLKVSKGEGGSVAVSEPVPVTIVSDIEPVIDSQVININNEDGNGKKLVLSAKNSKGKNLDLDNSEWTITGLGNNNIPVVLTGSERTVDISNYIHAVEVKLKVSKRTNGTFMGDSAVKTKTIDLDYKKIKPIITYTASEVSNEFTFSANSSIGNIDWSKTMWKVFEDGTLISEVHSQSTFIHEFPENSKDKLYTVALSLTDSGTKKTEVVSQVVYVDKVVMEPVIDYEILEFRNSEKKIERVKVILDASKSKGRNIDFNLTEWRLPLNNQAVQNGVSATFNLDNPGSATYMDVFITLQKRGGLDLVTKKERIPLYGNKIPKTEIFVNKEIIGTTGEQTVVLDVLESSGVNIDWEKTTWLLNDKYPFNGSVARIDRNYLGEDQSFSYTVELFRHGSAKPIVKSGIVELDKYHIVPIITYTSEGDDNTVRLSVRDTVGLSIDWSRTKWSIWDGFDNVKYDTGAEILHRFPQNSEMMGYPVMAEMYLKGDTKPFYAYSSIQVTGDELLPIIEWDEKIEGYEKADNQDEYVITFKANSTSGSGINWSQTKWTFGDGSPAAYGPSVQHKFPISDQKRSYKVGLTVYRRGANGSEESKTVYKDINFDADEIKPVIKAKLDVQSGTLVLSAEMSEGKGILLDRSTWAFAGKGDSEQFSRSKSHVDTDNTTTIESRALGVSATIGTSANCPSPVAVSATYSGNFSSSENTSDGSQDSESNNQTYSQQNSHVGAMCRRFISDFDFNSYNETLAEETNIWVSLFVYRQLPNGSLVGTQITERLNVAQLKRAGDAGVIYE